LPLVDRKKRLTTLVARRRTGIVLSTHAADDGATIFRQACKMGLEGIVSKRLMATMGAVAAADSDTDMVARTLFPAKSFL
jgi:hypothetical protein